MRLVPLGVVLAMAAVAVATGWHRQLSLETLVAHRAAIHHLVDAHRLAAVMAFVAIYATAVALSFPGAALLTSAGGIIFGTVVGGVASVVAATLGATAIFLLARHALGGAARCFCFRRASPAIEKLVAGFRDDAFCYLVCLRLVPLVPFWLVNLVSASAGIRLWPFVTATALGIVPATFAFAFFGDGLNDLIAAQADTYQACLAARRGNCNLAFDIKTVATPELICGLVILGFMALIPPAVKKYRSLRRENE